MKKVIENTLSTIDTVRSASSGHMKPLIAVFNRVRGPLACIVLIVLGLLIGLDMGRIFPNSSVRYTNETLIPQGVVQDSYNEQIFSFPYHLGIPTILKDMTLQMADRTSIRISEIMQSDSTKPLVLVPWTSWCRTCRYRVEMINTDLYDKYSQDMQFVALNQGERFSIFRRFAQDFGLQFATLRDSSNALAKLIERGGESAMPVLVLTHDTVYWINEPITFDTFQVLKQSIAKQAGNTTITTE